MADLIVEATEIPEFEMNSPTKEKAKKQNEDADYDVEDSDQENRPPQKRRRAAKKRQVDDTLFDALMNSSSINTLVKDWIDSFKLNQQSAIEEIVNFLVKSAGSSTPIHSDAIQDPDLITDALDHLESEFKAVDYPLLKGRKGGAKFRKSFSDYWTRLVVALKSEILFDEQYNCLDTIIQWLAAMSSSACRPIRHTATIASLSALTGLCQVTASVIQEYTKLHQQSEKADGKTKKVKERVAMLEGQKTQLESLQSDLFNGVFVHRYRDTDPLIRADCIHELGIWISKCPDIFLDSQYLRYLGWMLNDKVPAVRASCAKSMCLIFRPELSSGLRSFAERFKGRLISMALHEKETHVRQEIVKVLDQMNELGFLDEEENLKISVLIMDSDQRVRDHVVNFILEYWKTDFEEPLKDQVENRTTAKQLSLVKDKISLKSYCQMLTAIGTRAELATKEIAMTETKKALESLPEPARYASTRMVESDSLLRFECEGIISWMKRHPTLNEKIGYENVQAASDALIEHVGWLEEVDTIVEYLKMESVTDSNDYSMLLTLSEEERGCLFYVLSAVFTNLCDGNKKTKADLEKMANAQSCLLNEIPSLLKQYSKEFSGVGFESLLELVTMLHHIRLPSVVDQRLTQGFELMILELMELFRLHSSPMILEEICSVLGTFANPDSQDTGVLGLASHVKTQLNLVIDELLNELSVAAGRLNTFGAEEVHSSDCLASLQAVISALSRLLHLSSKYQVFRTVSAKSFEFERNSNGSFALFNYCLEGILQVLKTHLDDTKDNSSSFFQGCNEALNVCVKLMAVDYVDSMGSVHDEGEPSQEMLEEVKEKQNRLVNFLEAVTSDSNGEFFQIQFTLLQRSFCLETLLQIVPVLSGPVVQKHSILARPISSQVQAEAGNLLRSLLFVSTYELSENLKDVSLQQQLQYRYDLYTLVGVYINACIRGDMNLQNASSLLTFYGLSPEIGHILPFFYKGISIEKDNCVPTTLFGEVWNDLSEHLLKSVMGGFHEFADKVFHLDLEQELKLNKLREYVKDMMAMVTESIQNVSLTNHSLWNYF
jgi:hypothetical protein